MMEISTKGRYSLRILLLMASHPHGQLFTKQEIADEEDISCAYVQQLMTTLRTAGFVNSHRGKVGGFTLGRAAETITVADVLGATEGQLELAPCMSSEKCAREPDCGTRPLWMRATELLNELFGGVTIAQLTEGGANGHPWMAEGT
jgi:Rrf2 family protein